MVRFISSLRLAAASSAVSFVAGVGTFLCGAGDEDGSFSAGAGLLFNEMEGEGESVASESSSLSLLDRSLVVGDIVTSFLRR